MLVYAKTSKLNCDSISTFFLSVIMFLIEYPQFHLEIYILGLLPGNGRRIVGR